jgi:PBP1b-binding outer membrane lipoprotein LpoB
MRPFLTIIAAIVFLFSCSSAKEDPKAAAKSFFEAFAKKDFDKAAQFATKDSKTLIDLLKSMEEMGNSMDISAFGLDMESINKAIYENAAIDGNNATVSVSLGDQSQIIKLIKEEDGWKVAVDKDAIQERANKNQ